MSATGPFVHQAGQYTRPGDVTQLIKNVDDRFVVFGTGDEVQVDFDPSRLPRLPDGWERDYFFFADGYEKDMDFYAADGLTVEPLPYHAMGSYPYAEEKSYPRDAEHLKYLLDYNTRFYAGDERTDYRFQYKSAVLLRRRYSNSCNCDCRSILSRTRARGRGSLLLSLKTNNLSVGRAIYPSDKDGGSDGPSVGFSSIRRCGACSGLGFSHLLVLSYFYCDKLVGADWTLSRDLFLEWNKEVGEKSAISGT